MASIAHMVMIHRTVAPSVSKLQCGCAIPSRNMNALNFQQSGEPQTPAPMKSKFVKSVCRPAQATVKFVASLFVKLNIPYAVEVLASLVEGSRFTVLLDHS